MRTTLTLDPDVATQLERLRRARDVSLKQLVVPALAIERGLTLCSTDGDHSRFSGLRWRNPLVP
jgi:predicted nucleic acid-binding protein